MSAPGSFELTTPPASEPITLVDAKTFARVQHDGDDAFIGALITAARGHVENKCGVALVTQTWTATFDTFDEKGLKLRPHPVQSIEAVRVWDGSEMAEQDTDAFVLLKRRPQTIVLALDGAAPPVPSRARGGIEIEFVAGYGDADDVPEPIKLAMRQLISHWYENREPTPVSQNLSVVGVLAHQVDSLLQPYRSFRLG